MLQKFNITTYAVALCLFAFMLFTAAPVFADPQGDFEECQSIKPKGVDFDLMKDKKNCFRDIAEELLEINENLRAASNNDASSSDGEGIERVCEILEEMMAVEGSRDYYLRSFMDKMRVDDVEIKKGCEFFW